MLPITVARSSAGGVTTSQGEGAILGDFFPINNALYNKVFGTHTKTAEPIEMPGGPKEPCIRWGADPPRERGNFRGLSGPFKSTGNLHCSGRGNVAAAFTAKGIIQLPITSCSRGDHSVCQANANNILKIYGRRRCGLSAAKRVVGLHSAGEVSTFALLLLLIVTC